MNPQETSEVSAVVVHEEQPTARPVERLPLEELHNQLDFIRQVMAREMKEGQDYGKIPGCGDKPGLFQPGAQKLLLTFQLTPKVKKEVLRELPHSIYGHREYEFTISVVSKTGREWDGVGTCSTFESKYRYRKSSRKCPKCGKESIFRSKNPGEGWYCWAKKGGCGAKFGEKAPEIISQEEGKAENDNPAEAWNTVRKMAFKRAIVHAAINATNTSELWSQDLEDLPQAHAAQAEYIPEPSESFESAGNTPKAPEPPKAPPASVSTPPKANPVATVKHRMKALNNLQAAPGQRNYGLVEGYLRSKLWITGEQRCEDWDLAHVPATQEQMAALIEEVAKFERTMKEQPV